MLLFVVHRAAWPPGASTYEIVMERTEDNRGHAYTDLQIQVAAGRSDPGGSLRRLYSAHQTGP